MSVLSMSGRGSAFLYEPFIGWVWKGRGGEGKGGMESSRVFIGRVILSGMDICVLEKLLVVDEQFTV